MSNDHIKDFQFDPRNPRRHNPRNIGMIERSMNEVGVGRSIVSTKDGTIIAGNGVLEAAAQAGIEEVVTVHTNGTQLVVHVRDDIADGDRNASLLGLFDNRTAELSEWDSEVLDEIREEFITDESFNFVFNDREMIELMGESRDRQDARNAADAMPQLGEIEYRVVVDCEDEDDQAQLMEQLNEMGRTFRALLS